MKRLFLFLAPCCVFVIASTTLNAQNAVKQQEVIEVPSLESIHMASVTPVNNAIAAYQGINTRAVRSFKTTYKTVDNESWSVTPTGYRAQFANDGTVLSVTFNKKGKWLNTVQQYDETKLEKDVRAQVKSVYYDYSIFLVEEIEEPNKPVTYLIHMEDTTSFKDVRVCDRRMEVVMETEKL